MSAVPNMSKGLKEQRMKSFAIYGASDDLVEQEADGKPHDETGQPRSFSFVAGTKALHAKMSFSGKIGTGWKLTVELQDEHEAGELPFSVRIVQERYSPKLIVEHATEPVAVMSRCKRIAIIDPNPIAVAVRETSGVQGTRLKDGSFDADCG